MMRIALFLLVLLSSGLIAAASQDDAKVHVGKLLAVSRDNIQLGQHESILSIGFVGEPAALTELDGVKVGDQVRAVFGSTPRPDGPGRINKLLSIRRCATNDAQCAADLKTQDARDAEKAKAWALRDAEMAQCRRDMDKSLLGDTRYVPTTIAMPETQSREVLRQVNALTGEREDCANAVIDGHQAAVLEACELHHCGDDIGGGCSHIAGYSLSDAVIVQALAVCTAPPPD